MVDMKKDRLPEQSINKQVNGSTKVSQCQMILEYMEKCYSITPIDALNMFGCFRLASRVADLRKDGHNIVTDKVTKNGKTFASYRLEETA